MKLSTFFNVKIIFTKNQIYDGESPKTNWLKAKIFSWLWNAKGGGRESVIVDA
ncbi:MAG TPA: hypothetical protein ACFYD4_16455 [Candidatus Wunengus sp. YC61]|uniref:hypothetical protein n=1 Tax=Candidatus Wunengus sp. YC61 TaxID=3367698 RepID=UPI0040274315